ncbi:MAG: peptidoglycan DD-metalloendopeptidase family protein [Parvibaculum sp.]
MSYIRRGFHVLFLAALGLVVLNDDARIKAAGLFHGGYALVAGGRTAPMPLERPQALAQASLDDCLRGVARSPSSGEPYSDFCTDLASFADTIDTAYGEGDLSGDDLEAAPAPLPAPKPRVRHAAAAPAPAEPVCLVDENGGAAIEVDGIWMRETPAYLREPEADAKKQKMTQIVAVPHGCAVQSPVRATVLYAGTFKGYLGVVILETEKLERMTIAGLGHVSVTRGESVERGAEIGMTTTRAAPALAGATGTHEASLLYVSDTTAAVPAS